MRDADHNRLQTVPTATFLLCVRCASRACSIWAVASRIRKRECRRPLRRAEHRCRTAGNELPRVMVPSAPSSPRGSSCLLRFGAPTPAAAMVAAASGCAADVSADAADVSALLLVPLCARAGRLCSPWFWAAPWFRTEISTRRGCSSNTYPGSGSPSPASHRVSLNAPLHLPQTLVRSGARAAGRDALFFRPLTAPTPFRGRPRAFPRAARHVSAMRFRTRLHLILSYMTCSCAPACASASGMAPVCVVPGPRKLRATAHRRAL